MRVVEQKLDICNFPSKRPGSAGAKNSLDLYEAKKHAEKD